MQQGNRNRESAINVEHYHSNSASGAAQEPPATPSREVSGGIIRRIGFDRLIWFARRNHDRRYFSDKAKEVLRLEQETTTSTASCRRAVRLALPLRSNVARVVAISARNIQLSTRLVPLVLVALAVPLGSGCAPDFGPDSLGESEHALLAASRCIRYVHPAGRPRAKGRSWSDPYPSLSVALSNAACDIWVAEGTYTPGTSRSSTFTLNPGQTVYGGFERYQTSPEDRDIAAHPTILSGEIGVADDLSDNVYHVVTMGDQSVLDGVTVSRGNSVGDSNTCGGAICASGALVTVCNSTIRESGIAVQEEAADMTFLNCTFEQNTRAISMVDSDFYVDVSSCQFHDNGYGIYARFGHAWIEDSAFGVHSSNAIYIPNTSIVEVRSSQFQSAITNLGGDLRVEGSTFSNNTAISVRCGTDNLGCTISSSVFENNAGTSIQAGGTQIDGCRFSNNSATSIRTLTYGATITNSVFYGNAAPAITALAGEGHVHVINSTFFGNSAIVSSSEQPVLFLSSILWGNGSNPISGTVSVEYSDIDVPAGTGTNFSADPQFVSTAPGAVDLRLSTGSPCIDRAPVDGSIPIEDSLGNARYDDPTIANLNGSATDLGAYEYRP